MRMQIAAVLVAVLVLAVLAVASLFLPASRGNNFSKMGIVGIAVSYNGTLQQMNAYLASNYTEQVYGLMYKDSLGDCNGYGECSGMLFTIYNLTTANVCFWMKNTAMPLNMYWISNNTITSEALDTVPYSTNEICNAGSWVLETPTNTTLTVGSTVSVTPYAA